MRKKLLALVLSLGLLSALLPVGQAAERPWQDWVPEWDYGESDLYGYKEGEKWVIPPQFDAAEWFDEEGRAVVLKEGKRGIIDSSGAYVLPPTYDDIGRASPDGLRWFREGGKYGVMTAVGEVLHSADIEADWMGWFVNGSCVYVVGEKYGLVGTDGKRLTEPVYDEIESWNEPADGARPAQKGELWGILAADGTERTPFQYTLLELWSNGYGAGLLGDLADGKWYLLKPDGSLLTDTAFDSVEWGDPDSEDSYEAYDSLPDGDLAMVSQKGSGLGAVSLSTGELVYPCVFPEAATLCTAVQLKVTDPAKLWEEADRRGREAGLEVTWYPAGEGIRRLYGSDRMLRLKDGLCALSGLDGTLYTGYEFDTVGEPGEDGLYPASKNGKWGKLDGNGSVAVDFLYDTLESIGVNARFVSKYGKDESPYALADLNGTLLTGYDFWAHTEFCYGFAMVTDGTDGWRFIDAAGKAVTEQKYNAIGQLASAPFGEDGYAVVQYKDISGYNVIDSQGNEILPEKSYHRPYRAGFGLWVYEPFLSGVGIADNEGNVVIPPEKDRWYSAGGKGESAAYAFDREGYLSAGEGLYYNTKGELVERQPRDPWLREGLLWTSVSPRGNQGSWGGGWGFQDETGKLIVPHLYVAVGHFDQGYASVMAGGIFGMLKNPLLEPGELVFSDVPAGSWFEQGVKTCAKEGIMVGISETEFAPGAQLTQAECLTLALRLYDLRWGGDGGLEKAPEDWGRITLTTKDGMVFSNQGEKAWEMTLPQGGHNFRANYTFTVVLSHDPDSYVEDPERVEPEWGEAVVEVNGKTIRGTASTLLADPEGRTILGFLAQEEADDLLDALYIPTPSCWWRDAVYTGYQWGLDREPGFAAMLSDLGENYPAYRVDFAQALATAAGELPRVNPNVTIPDLTREKGEDIYTLYEAGILNGVDETGAFDRYGRLTRAEAAVMVARVLDESQRLTASPAP